MQVLTAILVLVIVVVGCITALLFRLLPGRKNSPTQDPDEDLLVQEMHRTLSRLEERMDVLETLLEDNRRR